MRVIAPRQAAWGPCPQDSHPTRTSQVSGLILNSRTAPAPTPTASLPLLPTGIWAPASSRPSSVPPRSCLEPSPTSLLDGTPAVSLEAGAQVAAKQELLVRVECQLGPLWEGRGLGPPLQSPRGSPEPSPGSHPRGRLAVGHWPVWGRGGGPARARGLPSPNPRGGGARATITGKAKAVVSLLSKYLWKPQEAAGWRAGPSTVPPPRPLPGTAPSPRGTRSGRPSGPGAAPAPSPALFCVLSTAHEVPECFTPGRAIAALSGVKCNLPEIKPNYGIS